MIFLLSTIGGAARSSHVFVCRVCLGAATARILCTAISKRLEYISRLISWLGRFLLRPFLVLGDVVNNLRRRVSQPRKSEASGRNNGVLTTAPFKHLLIVLLKNVMGASGPSRGSSLQNVAWTRTWQRLLDRWLLMGTDGVQASTREDKGGMNKKCVTERCEDRRLAYSFSSILLYSYICIRCFVFVFLALFTLLKTFHSPLPGREVPFR